MRIEQHGHMSMEFSTVGEVYSINVYCLISVVDSKTDTESNQCDEADDVLITLCATAAAAAAAGVAACTCAG